MPITPFPPAPSRADPANFADEADAYLSHLENPFAGEANALEANVNAKEAAATASATAAAASELAAANTANVAAWVSGTTYAAGVNVYDTTDFLTYRRTVAGAGTNRPGLDPTNWQLLTGLGNVSLDGVQTLTNKTHGSGSTWDGDTISIAKGGTGATTAASAFSNIKQAATETATGVVELATTAEAAAGTDTSRAVTPAGLREGLRAGLNASGSAPVYACRAWVNFNGTGTVAIRASGNVSSITDNGAGNYTINFTNAMPDADYNVTFGSWNNANAQGGIAEYAGSGGSFPSGRTASSLRIVTFLTNGGGGVDSVSVNASFFR